MRERESQKERAGEEEKKSERLESGDVPTGSQREQDTVPVS